jgi:hypothetical protein
MCRVSSVRKTVRIPGVCQPVDFYEQKRSRRQTALCHNAPLDAPFQKTIQVLVGDKSTGGGAGLYRHAIPFNPPATESTEPRPLRTFICRARTYRALRYLCADAISYAPKQHSDEQCVTNWCIIGPALEVPMIRFRASWLVLSVAFLIVFATSLSAQQPFANTRPPGKNPDVAAMPGVENMYVPPKSGQPFTAKSMVTWTSQDESSSHVAFMSMVARDSSGKIYFESRRTQTDSGEFRPRWNFIIIDPKEETRTTCYVATKSCRINAFLRAVYAKSEGAEEAPRASTMVPANLGTSVIDALTVEGTRETTSVAAGAYGNSKPLVITRELWHSPELDLDLMIKKSDPRSGTFVRKVEIISRNEPDPEYFTIPSDYTFLDNRPTVKK